MMCKRNLTSTQAAAAGIISSAWESLAAPTAVSLDAPTGRGKTRIVQAFYDRLVSAQPDGRRFWGGQLARDDLPDWRKNRKSVEAQVVDVTQRPDWLWMGLDGYPLGRVPFPSQLYRINAAIVSGYEDGRLPADTARILRRGPGRGVLIDLLRAATEVVTGLVPGVGLAKTGIEATLGVARAIAARDRLGVRLSVDDPIAASRAVLVTMFVASVLGGLEAPLTPLVVALDDAHLVDPSVVAVLDALMKASPDEELLGSGLLRGEQQKFAASRGLPPVAPVLILATSQLSNDTIPDHFGARVRAWSDQGLRVVVLGEDHLSLLSEEEAGLVVGQRLAGLGLSDYQVGLVVDHAYDRILEGVNASLLVAHCERVSGLVDPCETLTPGWVERHLPRFIEEDARFRFDALPLRAQRAVVAGALRGPAFAFDSVSTIRPSLGEHDEWADELENSGYARRLPAYPDTPQLVFSDEPSFAYAREQAVRDPALCERALTDVSAPLLRNLWASATVGPLGGGRALYELSRGEAYHYRRLVDEAGLQGNTLDSEIWAAVLGFGAEREFALEEVGPPGGARNMRELWKELARGKEALSGDGWAIAARWVIHKYLPGPMTFGAVWSARTATKPLNFTRLHPKSRKVAAQVASRVLPSLLADNRPLYEPGLRLLLRLGFAGRLLTRELRRLVATRLLQVAHLRLSAAVLLAQVYRGDLGEYEQEALFSILIAGLAYDSDNATQRRSLGLAWLEYELPTSIRVEVVDGLVSACSGEVRVIEADGFGISGRIADVSDPIIFPWANVDVHAAAALLTHTNALSTSPSVQKMAARKLLESAERHPGVPWILLSEKARIGGEQLAWASAALEDWRRCGALPAGQFDLTGSIQVERESTKKRERQQRRR